MKSFTHNNYRLREIAELAAQRARSDKREALTAIVFSAMSIEAMVNEVELVAKFIGQSPGNEGAIALAELLNAAEGERTSIWMKIAVIIATVSGIAPNLKSPIFEDVKLLIKLRNELVHLKSELVDDQVAEGRHRVLRHVIGKGVLKSGVHQKGDSWLDTIATPAIADWACSLPAKFAREVIDQLPETYFSIVLQDGWFEAEKRASLDQLSAALKTRLRQVDN